MKKNFSKVKQFMVTVTRKDNATNHNEQYYAEVVDIPVLDSYEQVISDTFEDLRDIKINIGGDQLTRERFSGAKSLRAGANDPTFLYKVSSNTTCVFSFSWSLSGESGCLTRSFKTLKNGRNLIVS
jgi:hypothetical protein